MIEKDGDEVRHTNIVEDFSLSNILAFFHI